MTVIDEQLVELQTRLAFQEDTIARLNDVVTRQQQQIDRLRLALDDVLGLIGDETRPAASTGDVDERPPHY